MARYYGVDLTGMWRGELSMRRVSVLVRGLPPGAGLFRMAGGDMAWSPVERAIREGAWQIVSAMGAFMGMFSKKPPQQPKPPEPPEVGWLEKKRAADERTRRKAARLRALADERRRTTQ